MFYARYVILQIGKKEVPFLLSDKDGMGWDRPRGRSHPYPHPVVSAGFVTWKEGDADSVQCFGEGKLTLRASENTTIMVQSRAETDNQVLRKLLSQPIPYLVLKVGHESWPAFVCKRETHDAHLLSNYQRYAHDCVVSTGMVDFGFKAKHRRIDCYGGASFIEHPHYVYVTRGEQDAQFMRDSLVKWSDNPQPGVRVRMF